MKSFNLLVLPLIFSFCPIISWAEISFDWQDAGSISVASRKEVESRFLSVASLYLTDKYANLGTYDFVGSPEKFVVKVIGGYERESGSKAEYFPGVNGGTLFADPSFFFNLNVFQVGAMHELCHAYDYIMTDKMRKDLRYFLKVRRVTGGKFSNSIGWYRQYLLKNEGRAFEREAMYLDEIRNGFSVNDYSSAMRRIIVGKKAHSMR
ncbi:MAG: hypothetical protein HZA94_02225 [Candidatus Vogelbacteria bacterium]|nr:hypothetical protein [Candidatus Vogelbacteria bacterium]